jgi:hypothetical protein
MKKINYFQSFSSSFVTNVSFFPFKLRPAELFLFGIWSSDQFEFETHDLYCLFSTLSAIDSVIGLLPDYL